MPIRVRGYTVGMSSDVSFQLDAKGGEDILTGLAMATIKQSGEAIQARAVAMAGSMSSDPPEITLTTQVGTIKRGVRAIATIRSSGKNAHQNYIGVLALRKAKDAGRV